MDFLKPKMSSSYLETLLVHSNSNWEEIKCFICRGCIKMQPTPDPSYAFKPLKYKIKMLEMIELCPQLLLFTPTVQRPLELVGFQGRISNCVSDGMGEGCAR